MISAEQGLSFSRTAPGVLFWSALVTPLLSPLIIRLARFAQGAPGARGIGALNG